MVEEKNKSNIVPKVIIGILLIIAICICGYIFITKDNADTDTKENNKVVESTENNSVEGSTESNNTSASTENNSVTESKQNSLITFDGSKSVNSNINNYTLSCQGNGSIFITVDSTLKKLKFSFTPSTVAEYYQLNWSSNKNVKSSSDINFDKKIVDLFFGAIGQSWTADILFILLEDGTIEYIPIVHMLNNVQGAAVSYGKVNGVENVTKLALVSHDSGVTTLAIKSDGSFYDLQYALEKGKY